MSRIIGIDLGTSTSEVAVLQGDKPFVIPDEAGEVIIPSVVGINEANQRIVGRDALDQFLFRPEHTVIEVKRLMGSDQKVYLGREACTPQQISAFILEHLKASAERYLGEPVHRAVITVPAYFTDHQRRAVLEAGQLAGLTVERIINEPTAAALAYGIEHMAENQYVLVYDLGGGTLDVTVLEMFQGVLEVKASSGNNALGGKDFDERMMDHLLKGFEEDHTVNLSQDKRAMARLKDAVEACKKTLSMAEEHLIQLPFIARKDGVPLALDARMTRETFEGLIVDLVESTARPIQSALEDAKLSAEDMDAVLLVGGSTRIPLVQAFIESRLGKKPLHLVDPDLAVVMGAAIQGGILNEEMSPETGILITDVCPYTLGVETLGFINGFMMPDVFDAIIPRNITIPATREKIYTTVADNQDKVEISVSQGENKKASLNHFLDKFILEDVPPKPAGTERIKVGFNYDVNGILQVEATIVSTGKQGRITIETSGRTADSETSTDGWEQEEGAARFRGILRRAETILNDNPDLELYWELENAAEDLKRGILEKLDEESLSQLEEILTDILYDIEEMD